MAESEVELLLAQIRQLEEINRQTVDVLDEAASYGELWQSGEGIDGCERLLDSLGEKLAQMLRLPLLGFCLLNEESAEFSLGHVVPRERKADLDVIFDRIVENGWFAWSLKEPKGVLTPPDRMGNSLFLHVIGSSRGIVGVFIGVLDPDGEPPPFISSSLLTVLLRQVGHNLEGIKLYRKLRENRDFLDNLHRIKDEQLNERKKIENWIIDILELILTLPLRFLPQAIEHVLSRLCHLYRAETAIVVFFHDLCGEELCAQAKLLKIPLLFSADCSALLTELKPHQPVFLSCFQKYLSSFLLPEFKEKLDRCQDALFIPLVQDQTSVGFMSAFFPAGTLWRNHVNGLLNIVAQIVMVHLRRSILAGKLYESEEKLNHAHKVEALGQMAGGIAHDFNNLLTGIIGFADLIKKKNGSREPELERDIDRILAVSRRAAGLTKKLVNFSRRVQSRLECIDIHETIFDVVAMIGETINRNIQIRTNLSAANARIVADSSRVQNVILNLCINARDAMPKGGILSVDSRNCFFSAADKERMELGLQAGHYFCCRVKDTGEGIDESIREKLFDPFFTTKGDQRGTGLGLACVLDTMRDHRGAVSVESRIGEGSAFSLFFPLAQGSHIAALYAGKRVTIIGNHSDLWPMLTELLQELGCIVACRRQGHFAPEVDGKNRPDLFVVDDPDPAWWHSPSFALLKGQNLLLLLGRQEVPAESINQLRRVVFLKKPFDLHSFKKGLESLIGLAQEGE